VNTVRRSMDVRNVIGPKTAGPYMRKNVLNGAKTKSPGLGLDSRNPNCL